MDICALLFTAWRMLALQVLPLFCCVHHTLFTVCLTRQLDALQTMRAALCNGTRAQRRTERRAAVERMRQINSKAGAGPTEEQKCLGGCSRGSGVSQEQGLTNNCRAGTDCCHWQPAAAQAQALTTRMDGAAAAPASTTAGLFVYFASPPPRPHIQQPITHHSLSSTSSQVSGAQRVAGGGGGAGL